MSSQKIESDNEQIKNKREETNNKNPSQQQQQQQKEQQAQPITEHTIATTATISKTTNEVINGINENQKIIKQFQIKVQILQTDINNKLLKQLKYPLITTTNYKRIFLILINQRFQNL